MLALAIAFGLMAASLVARHTEEVDAQIGPLRIVLVARQDIAKGTTITAANSAKLLQSRLVPERFMPKRYFGDENELAGLRAEVPVAAGTYLSPGQFGLEKSEDSTKRRSGTRAVELSVSGAGSFAAMLGPGARVDVVVTVDREGSPARSYIAYEDLPVLAVQSTGDEAAGAGASEATLSVTLRTTVRQAIYLIAAQSFASKITLLPRPVGDSGKSGSLSVPRSSL